MNIEYDFIHGMNIEVVDSVDDAAKYDIEKDVVEVHEDDKTIIQL